MTKRHVKCLGWTTAVIVTALGAAAPAEAGTAPTVRHTTHIVHPGESIQRAVDRARPGHTILIRPGTYRESVLITTPHLTIRGSGPDTVLTGANRGAAVRSENTCARDGNGICVIGRTGRPVEGVSIHDLTLTDYRKNGLWASRTDRLSVEKVNARTNGQWGMAQEWSTRGRFHANLARDNKESGIFIANTIDREGGGLDTRGASVTSNRLVGNRIGVTLRRVRNLTVQDNRINGNCGGVFVVGDEGTPPAGAMTIRANVVERNNRYCAGNSRLPYIQGSGIVLTGTERTLVTRNVVRNNHGESPLSGGIVLFKSFVGATNERNVISYNTALGNRPADLVDQEPGNNNRFIDNVCRVSKPSGLCRLP
ncbi:nitrous oxide reductase family maturation protein NosD [Streptomyces sp. NPDC048639]|uniref:right-handed parallel beta-helix repeat-containing protein n=1 Tax=Streptomyces sp. NPDC048639 TaxID=3365581 RepID=UPI00371DE6E6